MDENNTSIRTLIKDVNKKIDRDLSLNNNRVSPRITTNKLKLPGDSISRKSVDKYQFNNNITTVRKKLGKFEVIKEKNEGNKSDDEKFNFDSIKNTLILEDDSIDIEEFFEIEDSKISKRYAELSTTNISFFNIDKDEVFDLDVKNFERENRVNTTIAKDFKGNNNSKNNSDNKNKRISTKDVKKINSANSNINNRNDNNNMTSRNIDFNKEVNLNSFNLDTTNNKNDDDVYNDLKIISEVRKF